MEMYIWFNKGSKLWLSHHLLDGRKDKNQHLWPYNLVLQSNQSQCGYNFNDWRPKIKDTLEFARIYRYLSEYKKNKLLDRTFLCNIGIYKFFGCYM